MRNEPKPYVLIFKKERPSLRMNEARGDQLAKWWLGARPSEKTAIYDDQGDFQEILQASEISWIGKDKTKDKIIDSNGRKATTGFICEWGEWHPLDVIHSSDCGCWDKYGAHHSQVFSWIKKQYPDATIHTSKDFTADMRQAFILNYRDNGQDN